MSDETSPATDGGGQTSDEPSPAMHNGYTKKPESLAVSSVGGKVHAEDLLDTEKESLEGCSERLP